MALNYDIRPLQEEALKIFKVFAAICEKHKLRYYAAYGTALGAIRHKGFIPWDDDLDVAMPREDYNHFVKVVADELPDNMKFLRGGESFYAPIWFCRLLNNQDGIVQTLSAVTGLELKDPPFIDVFVLEGVPESIFGFKDWLHDRRMWRLCQLWRYPDSGYGASFIHRLVAKILGAFVSRRYRKTVDNEDMMRVFDELSVRWNGSANVVEPSFFRMKESRLLPKSFFEPARVIPFEDTVIRVASNVEEILTRYYGDYMKLPPENERVPPHVLRLMYEGHV